MPYHESGLIRIVIRKSVDRETGTASLEEEWQNGGGAARILLTIEDTADLDS